MSPAAWWHDRQQQQARRERGDAHDNARRAEAGKRQSKLTGDLEQQERLDDEAWPRPRRPHARNQGRVPVRELRRRGHHTVTFAVVTGFLAAISRLSEQARGNRRES